MPAIQPLSLLVVGATGAQGGAVARAALRAGARVRALVRKPDSAAARSLATIGVELAPGRLEDRAALDAALDGIEAVFSVQLYDPSQPETERRQAFRLISAARARHVGRFVQTSVSGVGPISQMEGWAEGRWDRAYWESKAAIEDAVLGAGFASARILRPAFMMENFIPPKAAYMFPDLPHGRLVTAVAPETRIALVAADDIGAAAVLAFADRAPPAPLELAGDRLTLPEIAAILGAVNGSPIAVETAPAEDLVAAGQSPGWVRTQAWLNRVGYPARPEIMEAAGLTPTRFADWAQRRAGR